LRESGVDATALLVHGKTVDTILTEAADLDIDLIVVGSHGRGAMYQLLVGSISEGVLHRSSKPVLVVPTHPRA
jgi:nucleotide-binding universal stress UspA family protein